MFSQEDHRKEVERRSRLALETDAVRFLLESVARLDLFRQCSYVDESHGYDCWAHLSDVTWHPELRRFPLYLEFWAHKAPQVKSLKALWPEIQQTSLGRCVLPEYSPTRFGKGLGLVTFWRDELTIIHNHPQFLRFPAIKKLKVAPDVRLGHHWFEPFIAAVAETCRLEIASEEAIIKLEEGDWAARDWRDYPALS